MSRTFKLSSPEETLSKRFVLVLHDGDMPMGTAVEKDRKDIDRMIKEWMGGKAAHKINGISANARTA